jgi:hypothetical protein
MTHKERLSEQIHYLPMGAKYWKWHYRTFTASAIAKWIRSFRRIT